MVVEAFAKGWALKLSDAESLQISIFISSNKQSRRSATCHLVAHEKHALSSLLHGDHNQVIEMSRLLALVNGKKERLSIACEQDCFGVRHGYLIYDCASPEYLRKTNDLQDRCAVDLLGGSGLERSWVEVEAENVAV